MSNDDFISGRAEEEIDTLSFNIALRSKIKQDEAYAILIEIGFYEERYGSKPMIIVKIVDLSNDGCSSDRIFAAIKLIPGQADMNRASEISDDVVKISGKVLRGEDTSPTLMPGKRAVDI